MKVEGGWTVGSGRGSDVNQGALALGGRPPPVMRSWGLPLGPRKAERSKLGGEKVDRVLPRAQDRSSGVGWAPGPPPGGFGPHESGLPGEFIVPAGFQPVVAARLCHRRRSGWIGKNKTTSRT